MTETLPTLLTNVGSFFTESLEWMGQGLDVITESPALFVMVLAMPIAGYGIGILKRLLSI